MNFAVEGLRSCLVPDNRLAADIGEKEVEPGKLQRGRLALFPLRSFDNGLTSRVRGLGFPSGQLEGHAGTIFLDFSGV
ncbi:MAG: hypothetical protein IE922_12765 [Sphingomonadales bacterium]|nr:hypothetical protein [Sphingomonadales bacterium]